MQGHKRDGISGIYPNITNAVDRMRFVFNYVDLASLGSPSYFKICLYK